ncbi:MAG: ATP synthase F1 subunit delta [Bdellovibrionota bacterium]
MAKTVGKLASRYARALLGAVIRELGREGNPTPAQQIAASLNEFAALWEREHTLSISLQNPMFEKQERANALEQVARSAGLPDLTVRFLRVCFEHGRISALPQIAQAFSDQADKEAHILQVELTTARPIDQGEAQKTEQGLTQQLRGNLRFVWQVDPTILGGMVIRYGGKVLDGSLAGRLARIEDKLRAEV